MKLSILVNVLGICLGEDKRGNENDDYYHVVPGFGGQNVHAQNLAGDEDYGTGGGFNSIVESGMLFIFPLI